MIKPPIFVAIVVITVVTAVLVAAAIYLLVKDHRVEDEAVSTPYKMYGMCNYPLCIPYKKNYT